MIKNVKEILGVKINVGYIIDDAVDLVHTWLQDEKERYICTTNPEFILSAGKNEDFRNIINNSDLSLPDGIGVSYALLYLYICSKLRNNILYIPITLIIGILTPIIYLIKSKSVQKRITGADFTVRLCQLCYEKNYNVFLLGGKEKNKLGTFIKEGIDVSNSTSSYLKSQYPGIRIIGATSEFTGNIADDEKTIAYIHKCMKENNINSIDILLVAYGQYNQEAWIVRNSHKIHAKVSVGIGASFDYLVGTVKRSPIIFQKLNLEWLFRLYVEPWRIKRTFKAFPIFPIKVYTSVLRNK